FQLRSSQVTSDNFHELVQILSTTGSPSLLLESLRQVWNPTLQSSGVTLTSLKKLEEDILGPRAASTLLEESNYWLKQLDHSKKSSERSAIQDLIKLLQDIRSELDNAASSNDGLLGLEESLEIISGLIDDIWKLETPIYNEKRMKSLLEIIDRELLACVETSLTELTAKDARISDEAVLNASQVCKKWVASCERHTSLFWPHQSLHPWKDPPVVPPACKQIGARLKQAAELRLQYHQIVRLLSDSQRQSLNTSEILQQFEDYKTLCDVEKSAEWERILRRFEENLAPAEEGVTEKLKRQFAAAQTPVVLISKVQRYAELIKRPRIKQNLRTERENLFSGIGDVIDVYQSGPDVKELLDTPHILQEVQAARYAETKLTNLEKLVRELLDDLPEVKQAMEKVHAAARDAETKRAHLVEAWIQDTQKSIADKELTLGTDSAVVELTGTSMMKVNYDPRLMTLIKEARALSGQGIELPREIKSLVERAGALAGRARELQKIANFHNTIGDRMIASQRPIMLATAMEFARAVQEQKGVVWSDLYAIDVYINRLKEYVQKFARQNSELATKHMYLRDLVANLLKGEVVNLIGSQVAWKDTLKTMRSVVDDVDANYGNTKAWKLHWDRQLLKVLDVAYRAALPNLVKKLPELQIELIFRDNKLQWRPSVEEIRAKIYSAIKRFLSIPLNFRGVGNAQDAKFSLIVDKNAYLFGAVYNDAEAAIATLNSVKLKWTPLAEPATADIAEKLKGKSPKEWEKAFKDTKQWAQQIGKLRGGELKLWCFAIDTATTRSDLESATRRTWDRLSTELRAEAAERLLTCVEFLSSAARDLEHRPKDIEEVALAYDTHRRIESETPRIAAELECATGLARLMAAWTREKLDGLSGAVAAWESLADRLERHKTIVAHHVEDAKLNLRHRAAALKDERERWETKWTSKPELVTIDWIAGMRERWTSLESQRDSLITDCQRVGLDVAEFFQDSDSRRLEAELEAEESNCRFQEDFLQELEGQLSEEWSVARRRLPRFHDWLDSWRERIKVQAKEPRESLESLEVDTFVGKRIRELRSAVELVQLLRGDELAEEHWNDLRKLLGVQVATRDMTLGNLILAAPEIEANLEKVKEVTKRALAENGIRQAIVELEAWESSAAVQLQDAKDSKGREILLMGEYGETLARVGELKLLIEGAKGAAGFERFAARAGRCESALFELEERIKVLGAVQRKWVYLEPVYNSGTVATPANDNGKWLRADKEFRYLIGEVSRDPRVPSLRRLPMPAIVSLKDLLDRCQRSLDEFLEEKRAAYPRLYFLSDEDLLELISGSSLGLKNHLPKLFQGVGSVEIKDGTISAIVSPEDEMLVFTRGIDLADSLPAWLANLEEEIRVTLAKKLEVCYQDRAQEVSKYPSQILLLAERIHFTERCEEAVRNGKIALKTLVDHLESQRAKFRALEDADDRLTALKARSLLLETVHHLNIVRSLIKVAETGGNMSWTWNRQLRFYTTNQGPVVKCAGAEFQYRFEYQGAAVGLVRTTLTEKCFLALTQAMKLGLGGSPTGPAGTGKTESVKALASLLGRLVLVFNCDEGMDASSMKRILGGLAQAGAWGCFDEFNRLEEKTLSAVAMLVRPLQQALRDNTTSVQLGEQNITLNPHCCVFITMNPAGSDYGGRNKLPDSLARLFRPIAMAHPDRYDIVKALLECAGFQEASKLAGQLVEALDMAEKLLTRQPHYDWGLRALRSVLDSIPPGQDERQRLLQAIQASTVPKLTKEDTDKFNQILQDVFVDVDVKHQPSEDKQALREALDEVCRKRGLTDDTVLRCEQLYDQLQSRMGVAVVGPPGCGKTLVRRTLSEALVKLGENMREINIFPGAIPKTQLLGRVDAQTREWRDGLLSLGVASIADESLWIVLNGDVEPSWAEALNSALDDNRILTLASGVSVKLNPRIRFIFETHQLAGASPATVSRLGVVHLAAMPVAALLTSTVLDPLPPAVKQVVPKILTVIDRVLEESSMSCFSEVNALMQHLQSASTMNKVTYALLMVTCFQAETQETRNTLANFILQTLESWCPDPQRPLDVVYNPEIDRLEPFGEQKNVIDAETPVLVTNALNRGLVTIAPWVEAGQPVLVRGPRGSGKSSLVTAALHSLDVSVVNASSLFSTLDLTNRLKRSCVRLESATGRAYRPRTGSKVLLVIKDLHHASKNLQELIRQLLEDKGFHEDDLEFASLPVTILATADVKTPLHPRLSALLATHQITPPTSGELQAIIEVHLHHALKQVSPEARPASWISFVASVMQDSISETKEFFWTAKDLVRWARTLAYYPAPENEEDIARHLLDAGSHFFYPRLTLKDQTRWKSTLTLKIPDLKTQKDTLYTWQGNAGLSPLAPESWKMEMQNVIAKCQREGEVLETVLSAHLLQLTAGISWAFGAGFQGIVMAGRPGSGRRTATKLIASVSSLRLIDSGPGRGRTSIKTAVQSAGIDGERTLLLLEEHHLREEGLDVLASALISRGEVPGLYTPEELDTLVAPLTELARKEDLTGGLDQFLYHHLRSLLRVVVIVDTTDWNFTDYALEDALMIAEPPGAEWWTLEARLQELGGQLAPDFSESQGLKHLTEAHLQAPRGQQSPARFYALVNSWSDLRATWSRDIESKIASLEAGIGKLKEAGDKVAKLEDEASKQRKELEVETGRANAALEQITATMRGATGQRGEMTSLKADTERESAELARRKIVIEGELSKVEPLVEAASHAVANINADALAEVRSLRAPPAAVRDVLEGVLRLMGIKDTSWNSMKIFLAKRGVKDEIRTWDARRSTQTSLDAVEKLVKERPESFEEKTARRASVAAAPLAAWVLANLQYGKILQQVAPLEREQRQLAEKLAEAEAQIDKLAEGLNSVESRVKQLQDQLAEHSHGAAALQVRSEATEASLKTARALLEKLDVEYRDWELQLENLNKRKTKLDVEAAQAVTLLVYETIKDEKRREVIDLLISERERLIWRAQDLPADSVSIAGAACALRGPLVPLFIDSSGVAVNWLKRNLENQLEVTKPSDAKFLMTLELAVRFGKALLVEEIVELPSIFLPLLRKRFLKLGDRILSVQNGFKLFLATRRDKINTLPREADAVLFKITMGAGTRSLAERFVEQALLQETPELDKQRREALELEEKLAGERDQARVDLLAQLANARGEDLLQDSSEATPNSLLSSLEATQAKAKEIARALGQNRQKRDQVTQRAREHEKLAKFAAQLFKPVKALAYLNPLYVFSVEAYAEIYLEAEKHRKLIDGDSKEADGQAEKKLMALTLNYCAKAAYRKDRLPLALYLALVMYPVSDSERHLLFQDSVSSGEAQDSSVPDWVPEERRAATRALLAAIPQLGSRLRSEWLDDLNTIYKDSCSSFQKLLVVQALRPDHLNTALTKYVTEKLSVKDLAPSTWTMESVVEAQKRPVLFLLSPGADPGPELSNLASRLNVTGGFVEVSLGQGQVDQAEMMIDNVCRNGGWILLSNLQLALNWLPKLESILRNATPHESTRIWLTTEECAGFYPGLAGLCLKLAYEPPEGVKRNLKRSLRQLQSYRPQSKDSEGVFVLAWLHAVLQERRKFVPRGWIRAYEWSEADLEAARELVVNYALKFNPSARLDWEEGRGLLDVAIYGGRLQDRFDMRVLEAIIKDVWAQDVFQGRRRLGKVLSVPEACKRDPARYIDQLADADDPLEIFGLPANALRAWERSAAEVVVTELKGVFDKSMTSDKKLLRRADGKFQRDIKSHYEQLSSALMKIKVLKGTKHPIQEFFVSEIVNFNALTSTLKDAVSNNRITSSKTPSGLLERWPSGSKEILAFINDLAARSKFLAGVNVDNLLITSNEYKKVNIINLSFLSRPKGFLAAVKQFTARELRVSMSELKLSATWLENSELSAHKTSNHDKGVVISGLIITGATISNGSLVEVTDKASAVVNTPLCLLKYVIGNGEHLDEGIEVPVYNNLQRDQLICSLRVNCSRDRINEWVKRSVVIYLGLN
ncbi:GSCOCG00008639001-RA-CDS, partial [Cotesia congregata]